ncbi:hypothetical protein FQA39_LY19383 [Lamprigera yunnana]|nr:hypothetical protein FQA39_LY19383 [Lamprigera yunnana]
MAGLARTGRLLVICCSATTKRNAGPRWLVAIKDIDTKPSTAGPLCSISWVLPPTVLARSALPVFDWRVLSARPTNAIGVPVSVNNTPQVLTGSGPAGYTAASTPAAPTSYPVLITAWPRPASDHHDAEVEQLAAERGWAASLPSATTPIRDIFQAQLEWEKRYLVRKWAAAGLPRKPALPGIFARRATVQGHVLREYQAASPAQGTGCMAALDAQRFLEQDKINRKSARSGEDLQSNGAATTKPTQRNWPFLAIALSNAWAFAAAAFCISFAIYGVVNRNDCRLVCPACSEHGLRTPLIGEVRPASRAAFGDAARGAAVKTSECPEWQRRLRSNAAKAQVGNNVSHRQQSNKTKRPVPAEPAIFDVLGESEDRLGAACFYACLRRDRQDG